MTSYRYRAPQELHMLSVLAQSAGRQATGCLKVSDNAQTWSLFLEQGKVVYASNSVDPFGRLDRYLRRLSNRIPSLASPVRVQVRLLFEQTIEDSSGSIKDYEAICWLVEQQYLTHAQAGELIESLAKEVMETMLPLRYGNCDLLEKDLLADMPRFCQLNLRSLVEACQIKQPRRPTTTLDSSPTPVQPLRVPNSAPSPNGFTLPENGRAPSFNAAPSQADFRPSAASVPNQTAQATYTIACIDDSPTVLSAIEAFLDDKAFRVLRIENPVSALMQIIRNKPDLILLDVTMPNLDGYELCSLLRRHPSFKQTPIVMVTGNRGFIDRAKAKLVGASGYLTKPFTQPDLLKIIFMHLN